MEQERLADKAAERGAQFFEGLQRLAARHPVIGDVRGIGLMIGIELVRSRETREPDAEFTKRIHKDLRERGVLVSTTGVEGCILRITPPLVLTGDEVDHALRILDESFASVAQQ